MARLTKKQQAIIDIVKMAEANDITIAMVDGEKTIYNAPSLKDLLLLVHVLSTRLQLAQDQTSFEIASFLEDSKTTGYTT